MFFFFFLGGGGGVVTLSVLESGFDILGLGGRCRLFHRCIAEAYRMWDCRNLVSGFLASRGCGVEEPTAQEPQTLELQSTSGKTGRRKGGT